MRVQILYGFRGRESKERYYPSGEYDLEDGLAKILIADGHAIQLDNIPLNQDESIATKVDPLHKASLDELRKAYQDKTGKRAFHAWDTATLKQKLAELDIDNA